MELNDDIFDSFFACIGAVKEAKVTCKTWVPTFVLYTNLNDHVLLGFWCQDGLPGMAGSSEWTGEGGHPFGIIKVGKYDIYQLVMGSIVAE